LTGAIFLEYLTTSSYLSAAALKLIFDCIYITLINSYSDNRPFKGEKGTVNYIRLNCSHKCLAICFSYLQLSFNAVIYVSHVRKYFRETTTGYV